MRFGYRGIRSNESHLAGKRNHHSHRENAGDGGFAQFGAEERLGVHGRVLFLSACFNVDPVFATSVPKQEKRANPGLLDPILRFDIVYIANYWEKPL